MPKQRHHPHHHSANGASIGSYGSSVWVQITMQTSGGTVKAQPSTAAATALATPGTIADRG